MGNDEVVKVVERRLSISIDVADYAAKYDGIVGSSSTQLDIEILKLDLLAPEVVSKASKCGSLIFFAVFVVELICVPSVAAG